MRVYALSLHAMGPPRRNYTLWKSQFRLLGAAFASAAHTPILSYSPKAGPPWLCDILVMLRCARVGLISLEPLQLVLYQTKNVFTWGEWPMWLSPNPPT